MTEMAFLVNLVRLIHYNSQRSSVEAMEWFQVVKGIHLSYTPSPCLFSFVDVLLQLHWLFQVMQHQKGIEHIAIESQHCS